MPRIIFLPLPLSESAPAATPVGKAWVDYRQPAAYALAAHQWTVFPNTIPHQLRPTVPPYATAQFEYQPPAPDRRVAVNAQTWVTARALTLGEAPRPFASRLDDYRPAPGSAAAQWSGAAQPLTLRETPAPFRAPETAQRIERRAAQQPGDPVNNLPIGTSVTALLLRQEAIDNQRRALSAHAAIAAQPQGRSPLYGEAPPRPFTAALEYRPPARDGRAAQWRGQQRSLLYASEPTATPFNSGALTIPQWARNDSAIQWYGWQRSPLLEELPPEPPIVLTGGARRRRRVVAHEGEPKHTRRARAWLTRALDEAERRAEGRRLSPDLAGLIDEAADAAATATNRHALESMTRRLKAALAEISRTPREESSGRSAVVAGGQPQHRQPAISLPADLPDFAAALPGRAASDDDDLAMILLLTA